MKELEFKTFLIFFFFLSMDSFYSVYEEKKKRQIYYFIASLFKDSFVCCSANFALFGSNIVNVYQRSLLGTMLSWLQSFISKLETKPKPDSIR